MNYKFEYEKKLKNIYQVPWVRWRYGGSLAWTLRWKCFPSVFHFLKLAEIFTRRNILQLAEIVVNKL